MGIRKELLYGYWPRHKVPSRTVSCTVSRTVPPGVRSLPMGLRIKPIIKPPIPTILYPLISPFRRTKGEVDLWGFF